MRAEPVLTDIKEIDSILAKVKLDRRFGTGCHPGCRERRGSDGCLMSRESLQGHWKADDLVLQQEQTGSLAEG